MYGTGVRQRMGLAHMHYSERPLLQTRCFGIDGIRTRNGWNCTVNLKSQNEDDLFDDNHEDRHRRRESIAHKNST